MTGPPEPPAGGAVSLLWPDGARRPGAEASRAAVADLDLDEVVRSIVAGAPARDHDGRLERFVVGVLLELVDDPDVVAYRQEVFADLLELPAFRAALVDLHPVLAALGAVRHAAGERPTVHDVPRRLAELELLVDAALRLLDALDAGPRARAFTALRVQLGRFVDTDEFGALRSELPGLRATLERARSVTVGINLSPDLVPESATILALSPERVDGRRGLLGLLLGAERGQRGVTPLRSGISTHVRGQEVNGLVQDLRQLVDEVAAPVAEAAGRYAAIGAHPLAALGDELGFYLGAAAMVEELRAAGLPTCRPDLAPADERVTVLEDAYHPGLALRMLRGGAAADLVRNDARFDDATARVWVLTGPNRGGKTTYTRALGAAHVLAQAGLHAPARAGRLSPVDAVLTHFPAPETGRPGQGKLDEEAERLAAIFRRATPRSLVLLNEVLAGTSAVEALGLAAEALRGLRLLGARATYVTHLHELAGRADALNAATPGASAIGSLVAEAEEDAEGAHRRTFRVRIGPPRGVSYASEIAEQHGVSFPQLVELFRARGFLPDAAR